MKHALVVLVIFLCSAGVQARICGSIVKDGKKTAIPCNTPRNITVNSSPRGHCYAQITVNGKTHTIKPSCPSGKSVGAGGEIKEPQGDFLSRQQQHKALINQLAVKHHLDPALVHAVISVESAYRSDAVSAKGATGLMQLMPATADDMNVNDPYNPRSNLDGGMRYLRLQLERFKDTELALAAYNAGPETLVRYKGTIPPYAETQHYVQRVMAYKKRYQSDWQQHIK